MFEMMFRFIDFILYRFLNFSYIVRLGTYTKITAAQLLSGLIFFNLIVLSDYMGLFFFKRKNVLPELAIYTLLFFGLYIYYRRNADLLIKKYSSETKKSKWIGFSAIILYMILTFMILIR